MIEYTLVIGARMTLTANWAACPFDMRLACYRDLSGGRSLMVHRAIDWLFSICCVVNDVAMLGIRLWRLSGTRYWCARRLRRILCGIRACRIFGGIGYLALRFVGLDGLLHLLCFVGGICATLGYAGHDDAGVGV